MEESGEPAPESPPEEPPWPEPLEEALELGPDELPAGMPLELPDDPVLDELLDEPIPEGPVPDELGPDELPPEAPGPDELAEALVPDELVPDDVAPEEPPGTLLDPPLDALFVPPELLPALPVAPVESGLLEHAAPTLARPAAMSAKGTADGKLFKIRSTFLPFILPQSMGRKAPAPSSWNADAPRCENGSRAR